MFFVIFARYDFFSFQSYVHFKDFCFPVLLLDLAPNVRALGLLVSTMHSTLFLNSALSSGIFFCEP